MDGGRGTVDAAARRDARSKRACPQGEPTCDDGSGGRAPRDPAGSAWLKQEEEGSGAGVEGVVLASTTRLRSEEKKKGEETAGPEAPGTEGKQPAAGRSGGC